MRSKEEWEINNMIQETSRLAYFEEVKPTIGNRHKEVITALSGATDMTNSELAEKLDWGINRVTPRIWELREKGIVIESQKRPCRVTSRTALAWKIKKTNTLF